MKIMQVVTYIAAVIAALILLGIESAANGAPQEAAGAALALAVVAIPYCVTATIQRATLLNRAKD